jgi:hypothetical protein
MQVTASTKGAKLKELLRKGITLSRRLKKLDEDTKAKKKVLETERKRIEKRLIKLMESFKNRDPHDTMTFTLDQSDARGVEVSWSKDYPVDYTEAMKLEKPLGDNFDKVFSIRPAINRARSFKTWMTKDQGPFEKLKKKIKACVEERFVGPKFKWRFETNK